LPQKSHNAVWLCSCICGKETEVRADYLKSGKIVSCGCYRLSKLTANDDNTSRALLLFNDGLSVFEIAQRMKVSPSNVQKFLNTCGVKTVVSLRALGDYRSSDKDKWCVLYRDWGMSVTEIALYDKTTTATVLSVLRKKGIKVRSQSKPSPRMISEIKVRVEQYKSLYEQGFTLREIAERFNRTNNAIAYLLTSHGCTLRSRKEEIQSQRIRHKKEILGLIESRNVKLSETSKAPTLREVENKLRERTK
jgi:predicted DNA-binding protein YlxM (UPF0122 family)